jgi:hypothetical protein
LNSVVVTMSFDPAYVPAIAFKAAVSLSSVLSIAYSGCCRSQGKIAVPVNNGNWPGRVREQWHASWEEVAS